MVIKKLPRRLKPAPTSDLDNHDLGIPGNGKIPDFPTGLNPEPDPLRGRRDKKRPSPFPMI